MTYAKKAALIGKRAKIKTTLPIGLTIKVEDPTLNIKNLLSVE
jgi:hypothetical protein